MECQIKNVLDDGKYAIANKDNLYTNLKKKITNKSLDYLLEQYNIDIKTPIKNLEDIFENKIWIMKPVGGFKGVAIKILESYKDYLSYHTKMKKSKYENWVLQEYITNPLLLSKKKFHIRAYYLY